MNTVVSTLSDLIKIFTDTFRLPALFPALIFVLLNRVFIFRYFEGLPLIKDVSKQEFWDQALVLGLIALVLGYTINAFEVPIIRLYEGYQWKNTLLGKFFKLWHTARWQWLHDELSSWNKELIKEYRKLSPGQTTFKTGLLDFMIKSHKAEILRDFPPDPARILPTKLGNVMSSNNFEAYL